MENNKLVYNKEFQTLKYGPFAFIGDYGNDLLGDILILTYE